MRLLSFLAILAEIATFGEVQGEVRGEVGLVCPSLNRSDDSRGSQWWSDDGSRSSRRRRYLAFPKGSAFVVTVSLIKAIQVSQPKNWNLALEADAIWPIPSRENLRKISPVKRKKLKRRHRRELYANFELALDRENLPGRRCILRMICETRQYLSSPGFSFSEDLLRIILSNEEDTDEPDDYDVAYRTEENCETSYPCPLSMLQLFLSTLYAPLPSQ